MLLRVDDNAIRTEHSAKTLNSIDLILNLQIFCPIDALGQSSWPNIVTTPAARFAQALAIDVQGGTA